MFRQVRMKPKGGSRNGSGKRGRKVAPSAVPPDLESTAVRAVSKRCRVRSDAARPEPQAVRRASELPGVDPVVPCGGLHAAVEAAAESKEAIKEDTQRALRLMHEVLEHDGPGESGDEEVRLVSRKSDGPQHRKVFVGGLPWKAGADAVEEFFEKCGEIDSFNMPNDKVTGKPMGIAFVVYARRDSVERALAYDGKTYGGQKLRVKVADPDAKGKGSDAGQSEVRAKPRALDLGAQARQEGEVNRSSGRAGRGAPARKGRPGRQK